MSGPHHREENRGEPKQNLNGLSGDLCEAFEKHDAEAFRPFFTDDVVYHNIPMDPAVGIEESIAFITGFLGMFDSLVIETLNLAVRGNVVLTERVDTFKLNGDRSGPARHGDLRDP